MHVSVMRGVFVVLNANERSVLNQRTPSNQKDDARKLNNAFDGACVPRILRNN